MNAKRFRVLDQKLWRSDETATVPWALIEPLRASCMAAHGQTLERLDERGGLSRREMYAHVHGLPFREWMTPTNEQVETWFATWSKGGDA